MEVILVQENFIDGVKVSHCGVVIWKKTIDVNDKETRSFNLPDLDGTTSMIELKLKIVIAQNGSYFGWRELHRRS